MSRLFKPSRVAITAGVIVLTLIFINPNHPTATASNPDPYIINQNQTDTTYSTFHGAPVGQVFKPTSSGIVDKVITWNRTIGGSGNPCRAVYLKIYQWLGDGDNEYDPALVGNLLAESGGTFCKYSFSGTYGEAFTWEFSGDNEIILLDSEYYYVEATSEGTEYVEISWYGVNDDSLIDGQARRYDGDFYLQIPKLLDGHITINEPPQYSIFRNHTFNVGVDYIQPYDEPFNKIEVNVKEFQTGTSIAVVSASLSPTEQTPGQHSKIIEVTIPVSGSFQATVKLRDCSVFCRDGAESNILYFSDFTEPTEDEYIINQGAQTYDVRTSLHGSPAGQVFRPTNSGILKNVITWLKTGEGHSNPCRGIHLEIYQWLGDGNDEFDPSLVGELLGEANPKGICRLSSTGSGGEWIWEFPSYPGIVLTDDKYYYVKSYLGSGDYVIVTMHGSSNESLIDGKTNRMPGDFYLKIEKLMDSQISINQPDQYEVLPSRTFNTKVNYTMPAAGAANKIEISIRDFFTNGEVKFVSADLSPEEQVIDKHTKDIEVNLPKSGNFKMTTELKNCFGIFCTTKAESETTYFSELSSPLQDEFILEQTHANTSARGDLQGGLHQVFKPANPGVIERIKMNLSTSGNFCNGLEVKIYEWLGDPNSTSTQYKGDLVAQSNTQTICSHTAWPNPINYLWNFPPEGQTLLSKDKYYLFEFDAAHTFMTLNWGASTNDSLIDGRGWDKYNSFDLFMTIEGELTGFIPEHPVIIVPGITGSRLNRVSDGQEVWPDITRMLSSPSDDYLNELKLNDAGDEFLDKEVYPSDILRIAGVKVVYENLITKFLENGYTEGINLFVVPYDWRKDIRSEISRLDLIIQDAITHSPTGKVDIVAHSMGTLLAKEYLHQGNNSDFVDKMIAVGSPQLGSPKAFKVLNHGDDLDFTLWGILGLNENKAREITQNMPGVYQLLPGRKYIDLVGSYIIDFRQGVNHLSYDDTNDLMTENPEDSRNPLLLNTADEFHQALDDQPFNAPDVYNVIGCQHPDTIGAIRIYSNDHYDIIPTRGDSTVPLFSALNPPHSPADKTYFVLYNETKTNHIGLIRDEPSLTLIYNLITESEDAIPSGISQSISRCLDEPINLTRILFSSHSPTELHIYDEFGNHTGPNETGDTELGIPDSNYEKIGGSSFASVPPGNSYSVVTKAVSPGSFDLKIRALQGDNVKKTITFLNIPQENENTNSSLEFNSINENPTLNLDEDGDGDFDTQVEPTSVLDEETSDDILPPETEIAISGRQKRDYYINVLISFTSMDDNSGVHRTEYSWDNGANWGVYTEPFNLTVSGEVTIQYLSTDRAGNPETIKEKTVKNIHLEPIPIGDEEVIIIRPGS